MEPTYISTRAKRSSGNAVLRHRIRGELLSTTYRFGPFRDPEVRRLNTRSHDQRTQMENSGDLAVKIQPSSVSRSAAIAPVGRNTKRFKWEYVRTSTADGKRKVIALSMHDLNAAAAWRKDKILAVLVRINYTRTPGTTKRDAGNGGRLILDAEATMHMDEEMIIATCLLMLKKEIDRQRAGQGAAVAAAVSGGG